MANKIDDDADAGKVADPFDPAALRLSQDFVAMAGVKKELTTVRVQKPNKQSWFRVHPDEAYRVPAMAAIHIKEDNEYYVVDPPLIPSLADELVYVALYTVITRHGDVSLWPIPLPPTDGKDLEWWKSARDAATRAMTRWVRLVPKKSLSAYQLLVGPEHMAEPIWPDKSLRDLLEIALGQSYLIRTLDHPAIKRLRGLA